MLRLSPRLIAVVAVLVLAACGEPDPADPGSDRGAASTSTSAPITEQPTATSAEPPTPAMTQATARAASPPPDPESCISDTVLPFVGAFVEAFNASDPEYLQQFFPTAGRAFAGFHTDEFTAQAPMEVLEHRQERWAAAERWTIQDMVLGPRGHRDGDVDFDVAMVTVQFIRQADDVAAHTVVAHAAVNCDDGTIEDWRAERHSSGTVVETSVIEPPDEATADEPQLPPTMTDAERDRLFQPGPPWQGQGTQGISQQEAEQFADYPAFWLGESFAGYNLQAILRDRYIPPAGIPAHEATDSLGFIYGDCTDAPCPVPIFVKTEPACANRPEMIGDGTLAGDLETIRGEAQMLRFGDGHVRLWTGQVSIFVDARVDPSFVDQMVQELRGINVPIQPGEPLPAPDFSACSD